MLLFDNPHRAVWCLTRNNRFETFIIVQKIRQDINSPTFPFLAAIKHDSQNKFEEGNSQ